MVPFDKAFEHIQSVKEEFTDFCSQSGKVSEADTRVKLIDRILIDVLNWPESNLRREYHSESGYSDYILNVLGKDLIAVEAKRQGDSFVLPRDSRSRTLKISGGILTKDEIKKAIYQVRGYCDDLGIRYAIATNGYTWMVFRAIKENGSWREASAIIFSSIDDILTHFTDFWNLLSFDALCRGSLDREFGLAITPQRNLYRVLTRLNNPDTPLLRNSLHTQLNPIITHFFEDIADPSHLPYKTATSIHAA